MRVPEEGEPVGSIDRAKLAKLRGYVNVPAEEVVFTEPETVKYLGYLGPSATNDMSQETDLDTLRAQAELLGIKIDGRWGADRLRQEIADEQEND